MLHPFMPFITEELWSSNARSNPLIIAKWPTPDATGLDSNADAEVNSVIELISQIRRARTELNLGFGAVLLLHVHRQDAVGKLALHALQEPFKRLARVSLLLTPGWTDRDPPTLETAHPVTANATKLRWVSIETPSFSGRLQLPEDFDIAAEQARLTKAAQAAEKERDSLAARLANPSFVERAKPEAVEKARADHSEKASDAEKYRAALARLG
jgi:valyl-tRNA synthetase